MRKHLGLILFWPVKSLILGAIAWHVMFGYLEEDRRDTERNALANAAMVSSAHAHNLFRALEAVDQIAVYVKHGWETSNRSFRLDTLLAASSDFKTTGFFVSIIDKNGNLLTSTVPSANRVNIASEPYFSVHKNSPEHFYIGTARIGNFSRSPVVPFSRRLSDANGNFNGIVLVSVAPDYFLSGYDPAALGKQGFMAILSMDRVVRLARVGDRIFLPDAEAQPLKHRPALDKESDSMLFDGNAWFRDGRSRHVAYHTTPGYQMATMVGLDRETVLEPYFARREATIRNSWYATIALALVTLIGLAVSLRMAWRKDQLDDVRATYRTATESSAEGFFIARPILGENGRVTDFKIIDCNEYGAKALRFRREELLGQTVLGLYRGEVAALTMRMLVKAMKSRHYEGEADMANYGFEGPTWMQFRITRPGNDLAITMRDISGMKAHVTELERRGNEDALTHLPNRHWLNAFLATAVSDAAASRRQLALLFIDLDGFKKVNDTAGHGAGDEILRNAGRRLKEATRPYDHVARIGGDEFLIVLEQLNDLRDVALVAERVLEAFRRPFRTSQGTHTVGTSIGISMFPQDGSDAASLLKHADIAMYTVKMSGKNSYRYFDRSFSEALYKRHQMEVELRLALDHDELVMFYQPRIEVETGKTSSMEALVRWQHPTRGLIEPNEFIALAEETGLIGRLGIQVIDKVFAQLVAWSGKHQDLVPVSINVSARQFRETDIAALLAACLRRYRIDPRLIEIEITESSMMDNTEDVVNCLNAIQKMGIKLLVDDFGTGYSSLSQLQRLDFDVLKVDRSFTAELGNTSGGTALFSAIIMMAHSLGMRVVAEGVETLEQIAVLKALRCDEVQGYFISKPVPPPRSQPVFPPWTYSLLGVIEPQPSG